MKQKTKIFFRGAYNKYNLGDDLLLVSIVDFVSETAKRLDKPVELYVTEHADSVSQLGYRMDINLYKGFELYEACLNVSSKLKPKILRWAIKLISCVLLVFNIIFFRVFKRPLFYRNYINFFKSLDVIHYIGGGYFADRWVGTLQQEYLTVLFARMIKPDIIIVATGLGIGPVNRGNSILFKQFFKKFNYIAIRENRSAKLLEQKHICAHKKESADDTLLLMPLYRKIGESVEEPNKKLALNLKCFSDHNYGLIREELNAFLQIAAQEGYSLHFFCFGRSPGPNDIAALEVLNKELRKKLTIHDPYEEGLASFLGSLSNSKIGIGFAYHFNVLMAAFSRPVLGIFFGDYYEQKVVGVQKLLFEKPFILSWDEFKGKNSKELLEELERHEVNNSQKTESIYKNMKDEYFNLYQRILTDV